MADKDEVTGRMKQAGGSLTGDEEMKREGEDEETLGKVKDKAGDAKDKVTDKFD